MHGVHLTSCGRWRSSEAVEHSAYRLAAAALQAGRPDAARHPLVMLSIVFWPMIALAGRAPAPRRSSDEKTAT
jgi:hypothetical protein